MHYIKYLARCLAQEALVFFFFSASFYSEVPNTTERFRSWTQASWEQGWRTDQNARLATDSALSFNS